jgi:hypothetical protein
MFTTGGAGVTAELIECLPLRQVGQIIERTSFPVSEVDFEEPIPKLRFNSMRTSDWASCFERPFERARIYGG